MLQLISKHFKSIVVAFILVMASSIFLYAFSAGETGRTKKTSSLGCGSCHGNNPVNETVVSIIGPDTINAGQTANYFLTITKLSKTGAGLDIAVRSGSLSPVSNNIHLSNGELTHNANIPMTNGSVTIQYNYTAPNFVTIDTIWATGIATNSDGTSTGDDWNWAPSKRVIVRNATGIEKLPTAVPGKFELKQNYPNPFNPSTNIKFSVPASSFVEVKVFDITGKQIETLVNGMLNAGEYQLNWDAANNPSGIYFYKLVAQGFTETRKMILVK